MDHSSHAPAFDDYLTAQSILVDARAALGFANLAILDGATPLARAIVELGSRADIPIIVGVADEQEAGAFAHGGGVQVVRRDTGDFADALKALTGGRGADVVVDQRAGPDLERCLDLVADFGDVLVTGWRGGDAPHLFETMWAALDHCPCVQIWTLDRYRGNPERLRELEQAVTEFLRNRLGSRTPAGA